VTVYLTERDYEILTLTDEMTEPKPLSETWREEVILIDFLRGCEAVVFENNSGLLSPTH